MTTQAQIKWAQLLTEAVTKPGLIHEAYRAFHNYSAGNQILALLQCQLRGIQPGPIATFVGWKEKGRHVKKGEKAIILCMPITVKRKEETDQGEPEYQTIFVYKPHWFVYSQTDGEPFTPPPIPNWERAKAITSLGLTEETFTHTDGNVLGYAKRHTFAVSPVNPMPHKTGFHEMAHILLGHTTERDFNDGEHTPKNLREVEAEAVALICCESLGLPGVEYSRGYIQNWLSGDVIPEKSAQKIFHVADVILKAGSINESDEGRSSCQEL